MAVPAAAANEKSAPATRVDREPSPPSPEAFAFHAVPCSTGELARMWLILVGLYLIRGLFDINADPAVVFSSFKNYFFYPLLYFFVINAIDSGGKVKEVIHLILLTAVGLIHAITEKLLVSLLMSLFGTVTRPVEPLMLIAPGLL